MNKEQTCRNQKYLLCSLLLPVHYLPFHGLLPNSKNILHAVKAVVDQDVTVLLNLHVSIILMYIVYLNFFSGSNVNGHLWKRKTGKSLSLLDCNRRGKKREWKNRNNRRKKWLLYRKL